MHIHIMCSDGTMGYPGVPRGGKPSRNPPPLFLLLSPSLLSSAPPVLRHRFLASTTTNSTTRVLVVNCAVSPAHRSSRATFILGRRCFCSSYPPSDSNPLSVRRGHLRVPNRVDIHPVVVFRQSHMRLHDHHGRNDHPALLFILDRVRL